MFTLILLVLFFGCIAAWAKAGLWSNLITLFNIITAALLACNYWEPLSNWLDKQDASYTYLVDFISLWGIFAVSMGLMCAATDALSKVKVKFKQPVDLAGGIVIAAWASWILVCFTTMSLHTAPLARSFLGFQPEPQSRMMFGLAPDHRWLGFLHKESLGALSGGQVFDPQGEYIFKYSDRRGRFEKEKDMRVNPGPAH